MATNGIHMYTVPEQCTWRHWRRLQAEQAREAARDVRRGHQRNRLQKYFVVANPTARIQRLFITDPTTRRFVLVPKPSDTSTWARIAETDAGWEVLVEAASSASAMVEFVPPNPGEAAASPPETQWHPYLNDNFRDAIVIYSQWNTATIALKAIADKAAASSDQCSPAAALHVPPSPGIEWFACGPIGLASLRPGTDLDALLAADVPARTRLPPRSVSSSLTTSAGAPPPRPTPTSATEARLYRQILGGEHDATAAPARRPPRDKAEVFVVAASAGSADDAIDVFEIDGVRYDARGRRRP